MIRIRFHGRGGHGIKTAGRIVGTAAFLAGYHVQDSPVYGAERRGAPVTAFTRIDEVPILERGVIESPDLIVVADQSLLDDRAAAVLSGQETASGIFVNSHSSSDLSSKHGIISALVTFDISELTRETIGKEVALSAGLAAAAARLTGLISADQLCEGVREELSQLHAGNDLIEKNVEIATRVFESVPSLTFSLRSMPVAGAVHAVGYEAAAVGTASIVAPGNALQRNTGTWRVECPEIDRDICTRCGLCFVGCPEGAIALDEQHYPRIDYDHCKGCMICAQLCPLQAIVRRKEGRAW